MTRYPEFNNKQDLVYLDIDFRALDVKLNSTDVPVNQDWAKRVTGLLA